MTLLLTVLLSFRLALASSSLFARIESDMRDKAKMINHINAPTNQPINTSTPSVPVVKTNSNSWGVSRKLDEKTWTMQVGNDKKMATPDDIFKALNNYRKQNGSGSLTWDETLSDFAKKRAATFLSIGGLDGHAGFNEYFKNEDNMKNMKVTGVGENSSYGYKLEGVHLIEWVFAGDDPHNDNQLDKNWNTVGIAVVGTAVDLVFAKK